MRKKGIQNHRLAIYYLRKIFLTVLAIFNGHISHVVVFILASSNQFRYFVSFVMLSFYVEMLFKELERELSEKNEEIRKLRAEGGGRPDPEEMKSLQV